MYSTESTTASFVLLVDGDIDEREMYAFALSKEGLTPIEADSAEAALALAIERRPALVITDAVLPGQDGLAFTRRLRDERATASIPVIVVSGRVTDAAQARLEALTAGADVFLLKPCTPQDLIREARRLSNPLNYGSARSSSTS